MRLVLLLQPAVLLGPPPPLTFEWLIKYSDVNVCESVCCLLLQLPQLSLSVCLSCLGLAAHVAWQKWLHIQADWLRERQKLELLLLSLCYGLAVGVVE